MELGRRFLLVDNNLDAMVVMAKRFTGVEGIEWYGFDPGDAMGS
jgi:site-specific DNA-methyltransferase (adenine-specific)